MMASTTALATRAAELRFAFDRGFAAPLRAGLAERHGFLAIRVGTRAFAIRLSEVAGLFVDRKITRVPGTDAALLGIAGFRGALIPVYGLAALLGESGASGPRWLVTAVAAPVAFGFDGFEGHVAVAADAIVPQQASASMRDYAPAFIQAESTVRPVICFAAIVAALGKGRHSRIAARQE